MDRPTPIGKLLAHRYEIRETIGQGGTAVVYRAHDLKHDRDVAVKVLREELTQSLSADRFAREIEIAARLTHPNILPLYDSGECDGCFFHVAPFIVGESLRDRLSREGQLPIRDAVSIARAVASALEYAHGEGIVHRDIKPENILLAAGQAMVADFGIARVLQMPTPQRFTVTGLLVGTPAYMSPEQAAGEAEIGPASDIYSLGCVLFEMLAGEPPFRGENAQAVMASRFTGETRDVSALRPEVPHVVADLVAAMLERSPAERVQTAAALGEALAEAEAECTRTTGSIRRSGWFVRARRNPRRAARQAALAAAALVAVAGGGWFLRDAIPRPAWAGGGHRVQTLAVLPLANLSGDMQQDYFADGLTEALITDLSKLPGVKVISRTSVMQYRMMPKPLREVARELKADAVLEGSLMREGDRVRITAKLVSARDERNLWSESYDGRVGALLDLQRQVGFAVAREIGARLSPDDAAPAPAVKPESQQAYLKGASYAGQWRLEDAIASFQRAVEIDPANAPAYAALARAYYFRTFFGEVAPVEAFSQMRRAATAALQQDPRSAEAHGLMALVKTHFDYDWTGAEEHFRRALQLAPSNAQVHHDYAHFLLAMGRGAESLEESRRAVELDPANPMLTSCLGWHSLFDNRFDAALGHAAESQKMMPSFWAQIVQGWAHASLGAGPQSVAAMRQAVALSKGLPFARAALAHALARTGETAEARRILDELLVQARQGYVPAYDLAIVYAGLGANDLAFEWLTKAVAERSMFVVHLAWDARLDPLRTDARFAELVRRLGIPFAAADRAGVAS